MSNNPTTSFIGDQVTTPVPNTSLLHRIARYLIVLAPAFLLLASCASAGKPVAVSSTTILQKDPSHSFFDPSEPTIDYQASWIRDHLPAYLDFLGREVLPVISQNVDTIVFDLHGLTDIKPGLFYHGHIDYPLSISGGVDGLMKMDNVILQYHTLENHLIFVPYWREELQSIHDEIIDNWLERVNEYIQAISTPSMVSSIQYIPLTETQAVHIASSWDNYRKQNGLPSPGLDMLLNMVYLVDGGNQPLYQESFQKIYTFHSILFRQGGYYQLDNRTHVQNTFSPFQITFDRLSECQELLPLFEEARVARYDFIVNTSNVYIAQHSELVFDPKMTELSTRFNDAIRHLPDDNMIKISSTPQDQQIAYFAVGNYIFAVYGSLGDPPVFE